MQKYEVEDSIELEAYFAEVGCALESEALEEPERRLILGVDARDHGVLSAGFGAVDQLVEQLRSDSLAAGG